MTKTLSQLLGAREPAFRLGLRHLEQAGGGTAEDVRLTSEIVRARRQALRDLGLDPEDTTGRELYAALMQRVKEDSAIFDSLLQMGNAPQSNLMPQVARLVQSLDMPKQAFALRPAAGKRLLRQVPPRKALKALGYRSIDSVLKHESCAVLLAAAVIAESAQWHKSWLAQYKKLTPGDFELRAIQVLAPDNERWHKLASAYLALHRHNVLAFRELGAVVLLPLPSRLLGAAPLAAGLMTVQAVNDIRAASTYLKLHSVRPDFGAVVAQIARSEPFTGAEVAGVPLSWKLVHDYFSRHPDAYNPGLFEPHVQREDLQWQPVEAALAALHPRFAFWQPAAFSGLVEKSEVVSLNITDAVLSFCNMLPFEQRFVGHARSRLWHELMVRYLRQPGIERVMHDQLGSALNERG